MNDVLNGLFLRRMWWSAGVVLLAVFASMAQLPAEAGVDWSGKKVSILGDSYSTWNGTLGSENDEYPDKYDDFTDVSQQWWAQVIAHFNGTLDTNRSRGGSGMAQSGGYGFLSRLKNGGLGNPDVIFVMGGLNDDWVFHYSDEVFETGVKNVFAQIRSAYPQAKVYVILNKLHELNASGSSLNYHWGLCASMRGILQAQAETSGFTVIDLQGKFGTADSDMETPTYCHPTVSGMKKIANAVIAAIDADSVCKHPESVLVVTGEPDCTTAGSREYRCADCGEVLRTETIPARGHAWGEWADDPQDPTKEKHVCSRCGASESVPKGTPHPGEELPDGWGFAETKTLEGISYSILTFTNTASAITWQPPRSVCTFDYLVVGGGAGGGCFTGLGGASGGGGGGAALFGTVTDISAGSLATISVGAGGVGSTEAGKAGGNGGDSSLALDGNLICALGGGGGGSSRAAPGSHGTGGGAACNSATGVTPGGKGSQGGNGGTSEPQNTTSYQTQAGDGGGGGGAGGHGGNGKARKVGGAGGDGLACDITGESRYYGGGGGGGVCHDTSDASELMQGLGGLGGGGDGAVGLQHGATRESVEGFPGTSFGGGGGGSARSENARGCGYQGVVIIRYMNLGDAPSGHSHKLGEFVTTLAPTCTNEGSAVATCVAAGCTEPALAVTKTLARLEHSWGKLSVVVKPEVGVAGQSKRVCTFCGAEEVKVLPALDAYGAEDTSAVTYTWKGGDGDLWASVGSWQPSAATCYGIPAGSKASAVFPATLTSPVTVVCTDTFSFKDIAFKSKAGVTLRGGTVKASSPATYATGAKQVIDGMAFSAQRIAPGDAENVEIVVRNGGSYGHNGSFIYGELSSHIKVRVEGEGSTVDIRSNTAQSPSIKGSDHVWEAVDGGKLSTIYTALFSEDARFSQTRPTIRLADGGAWSTGGTFRYGTRSDADTPTVILEGRQPSFTSSLNGDAFVLGTNTAASVAGKTTLRFVPPADGWAAAPMQATKGRAIIGANTSVIVDATKLALDGATVTLPLVYAKSGIEIDAAALESAKVSAPEGATGTVALSADDTQLNAVITGGTPCDHATTATRSVAATCTTKGQVVTYCTVCQKTLKTEYTDALGHDWGEWQVVTEATATTDGEKRCTCRRTGCNAFKTETIPATGGGEPPVDPSGRKDGVARAAAAGRPLRLLVIGNSFSQQVQSGNYGFPEATRKLGRTIDFAHLYHGGATLQQHWQNRESSSWYTTVYSSFDSEVNPFKNGAVADNALVSILVGYDWDVISIQQGSTDSPYADRYDPYMGQLMSLFAEKAPNAEVKFHQTWAYDRDSEVLKDKDHPFGGNVEEREWMYDSIREAVDGVAAKYDLAVVASGYATQLYRYRLPVRTFADDPCFGDHRHFSNEGKYLELLTWCQHYYGEMPAKEDLSGVPSAEHEAIMRTCAREAGSATDFSYYGQGTVDFSWTATLKNDDGTSLGTLTATNGACFAVTDPIDPDDREFSGWLVGDATAALPSATVAAMKVYDDVTLTAAWVGGPIDHSGRRPTAFGWEKDVVEGDATYLVQAYTNTASAGFTWTVPADMTAQTLIVAGGGGGGYSGSANWGAGGGGAGAAREISSLQLASGTQVKIVVGKGGAAATANKTPAENGGNSSLTVGGTVYEVLGGGGGVGGSNTAASGGCGGGTSLGGTAGGGSEFGGAGAIGSNTTGAGSTQRFAGGGGGAKPEDGGKPFGVKSGSTLVSANGGKGGDGLTSSITGDDEVFGGGGGGGASTTSHVGGAGGAGGGGNGGGVNKATDGVDGYGGGGGGMCAKSDAPGRGGNGIVIVRYLVSGEQPIVVPHVHAYGAWTLTTPPTCTEDGVSNRVCTAVDCDKSALWQQTAVAPKLGHDFRDDWTDDPDDTTKEVRRCHRENCTATETRTKPTPVTGEDWGYSNKVTVAGADYMVVVFTNTEKTITWTLPTDVAAIDYLVVGGGGGGGRGDSFNGGTAGGGGGAGGVRHGTISTSGSLLITVGDGGAASRQIGNIYNWSAPSNGCDSVLALADGTEVRATGGGAGGDIKDNARGPGCAGGSGGGGRSKGNYAGGAGVDGEGFAGGAGKGSLGGGGGGASGAGVAQGAGGPGYDDPLTGRTYAGGGAGGAGEYGVPHRGCDGEPATGNGGEGGFGNVTPGGAGGSGVVIIRYALGDTPEPPAKDPVVPGEPNAYPTEAEAKAAAPTEVTPPNDVENALKGTQALANYVACFTVATRQNAAGQWVNVAELKPEAKAQLQQQVDGGAAKVVDALAGGTVTLDPVTPGFRYALEYGETLEAMMPQDSVLATDDSLALPIRKNAGATSGFYRVKVTE